MNKMNENKEISETINLLENGQYRERKDYLKKLRDNGSVEIGNFLYEEDVWCWVVWKPTDEWEQPQYKGDPLSKVVPRFMDKDKIADVLNAQSWIYW